MKLELIRPSKDMEQQYYDFVNDWDKHGEEIVPYAARLLDMDYDTWLGNTYRNENKETCSPEWVPAHTYFLVSEDKKIIGAINIRHFLNDFLLSHGGHIGYGIRPSERRKGYAALMLSLALPVTKKLGIEKALITCDKKNIASAKTIMSNGGVLENEVLHNGELTQRYWIEL
jgi:predicted acetyltransferase